MIDLSEEQDGSIKLFTVGEYKNNLGGYMNDNIHFYPKDMQEKYIENAFEYTYSNGITEGMNNLIKQVIHSACGYKKFKEIITSFKRISRILPQC